MDGVSLLLTILDDRQNDLLERFLYWEYPKRRLWQAGRKGKWKAVRNGIGEAIELYDLEMDPRDSADVSARHPELVEAFVTRFETGHVPSPHWPTR